MTGKIQHRRSISLDRGIYEALRIFHRERVEDGRSFTRWCNDELAAVVTPDYLERGQRLAVAIKQNLAAQRGDRT